MLVSAREQERLICGPQTGVCFDSWPNQAQAYNGGLISDDMSGAYLQAFFPVALGGGDEIPIQNPCLLFAKSCGEVLAQSNPILTPTCCLAETSIVEKNNWLSSHMQQCIAPVANLAVGLAAC